MHGFHSRLGPPVKLIKFLMIQEKDQVVHSQIISLRSKCTSLRKKQRYDNCQLPIFLLNFWQFITSVGELLEMAKLNLKHLF